MMMSSNENIFCFTDPLWGESTGHQWIPPVTDEVPSQRPVTRSFDVFFDLRLNKRLTKQTRRRWFEMPSRSWWRHCYVHIKFSYSYPYYLHRIMSTNKLPIWFLVISCMCMCVAPSLILPGLYTPRILHGLYTPWTIRFIYISGCILVSCCFCYCVLYCFIYMFVFVSNDEIKIFNHH